MTKPHINISEPYDVAIIGGGPGGYTAAIRAAQLGKRVALIERDLVGGTCLHRGCIPTKALLESSGRFESIRRAGEFGIRLDSGSVSYNEEKAYKRKDAVVDRLYKGIQTLMRKNKIDVIKGTARLDGRDGPRFAIQIHDGYQPDPRTLVAYHVVLATGSRPVVPPGVKIDGIRLFTSDEILSKPIRPQHITIVGAGAIGVEFARYFREIGSSVHLVEWSARLVPGEDEEISAELRLRFEQAGIAVSTAHRLMTERIAESDGQLSYSLESQDGEVSDHCTDAILFAMGRKNNTADLGLERFGLEATGSSVPVNVYMKTAVPELYAIGDITGSFQLAHAASRQATIAINRMFGAETVPYAATWVPRCIYTHPEIATVGLTERQAIEQGFNVKIGKFPLRANGRSLVGGHDEGFVKLVVDGEHDLLLGAHIIGEGATELIALPAFAGIVEGTAWEMGLNVYPHPTVAEIFGEAALAADGRAIHQ